MKTSAANPGRRRVRCGISPALPDSPHTTALRAALQEWPGTDGVDRRRRPVPGARRDRRQTDRCREACCRHRTGTRSRLRSARRSLLGLGIVPAFVAGADCARGGGTPGPRLVFCDRNGTVEYRVDHPPCRLDTVVPGEERGVTAHGIALPPLGRRTVA